MMKWSHTLIAGCSLILLTNAVVLLGAAYNRSDEPESLLKLTQRELRHNHWNDKDNSGITLRLDWRIASAQRNDSDIEYYEGKWGTPAWLDKDKMAELGFDVARLAGTYQDGRHYKEALPREALLVLELDGRTYQQALRRAAEYAEQARAKQVGNPKDENGKERVESAEKYYQSELRDNSRLFVVDAGVDVQKLRTSYPDRNRYAIVRGLVRPNIVRGKDGKVGGNISELHAENVNVPLAYRRVFDAVAPYQVTVAFGRRMEPWILAASRSAAAK